MSYRRRKKPIIDSLEKIYGVERSNRQLPLWLYIILGGMTGYLIYGIFLKNDTPPQNNPEPVIPTQYQTPPPTVQTNILPQTAVLHSFYTPLTTMPRFSLQVPVEAGNVYFQLKASVDNVVVMSGFVRAGEELQTHVPVGEYYLEYASGDTWINESELFGSFTSIVRSNTPLVFTQYMGRRVYLQKQLNGNLYSHEISKTSFQEGR